MPKISVIVPTYNRSKTLLRTLEALAGQTLRDDEWEVIVVDDGSTDGTAALVVQWLDRCGSRNFRLLSTEVNRGKSAACNLGISTTASPYVLFLDDDCLPDSDWARHHLDRQQASLSPTGVLGAVSFPEEWIEKSNFVRYLQSRYVGNRPWSTIKGRPDDLPFDLMGGLNISYPRQALAAAGLFAEALDRGQDTELAYRLWKSGLRFVFDPRPKVIHISPEAASLDGWLSKFLVFYERDLHLISHMHTEYGEQFGHWFLFPPRPLREPVHRTVKKAALRAVCHARLAGWLKRYLVRMDGHPGRYHPRWYLYIFTTLALEKIKNYEDAHLSR
jgi:glycosyltransferase involved in cell wall biosynthesis